MCGYSFWSLKTCAATVPSALATLSTSLVRASPVRSSTRNAFFLENSLKRGSWIAARNAVISLVLTSVGQARGRDHVGHLDHGAVRKYVESLVLEGRHVRKHLQPLVGEHADRLEQAFLDLPERFRRFQHAGDDVSAEQVGDDFRAAGIGHVDVIDAGGARRHRRKNVVEVVVAGRADRHLVGIGLHQLDEVFERFLLGLGRHQQHQGIGRDAGDVGELRIGQRRLALRDQRQRRAGAHADGVAIRCRARDPAHADGAGGADHVLDHDLDAVLAQDRIQRPRRDVVRAAGIPGHDEADVPRWIGLSLGSGGLKCGERARQNNRALFEHCCFLPFCCLL